MSILNLNICLFYFCDELHDWDKPVKLPTKLLMIPLRCWKMLKQDQVWENFVFPKNS